MSTPLCDRQCLSLFQESIRLWSDTTPPVVPADELGARVEGSGPYRGAKAGALVLLRAGVLHATGGAYNALTRWRSHGDGKRVTLSRSDGSGAVNAYFPDCFVIRFLPSPGVVEQSLALANQAFGGDKLDAEPATYLSNTVCTPSIS